jgi:hypothetical protein
VINCLTGSARFALRLLLTHPTFSCTTNTPRPTGVGIRQKNLWMEAFSFKRSLTVVSGDKCSRVRTVHAGPGRGERTEALYLARSDRSLQTKNSCMQTRVFEGRIAASDED